MTRPFQSFFVLCLTAAASLFASAQAQSALDTLLPKEDSAPVVVEPPPMRIAVLMPAKDSPFYAVTQAAVQGMLAANYATAHPTEILLVHPDHTGDILKQAQKAAAAGAMAAVGPMDRAQIEVLAREPYLPLPMVTLNQIEMDRAIPLTPEEIEERHRAEEARILADQAQRELNLAETPAVAGTAANDAAVDAEFTPAGTIAAKTNVKGFVAAADLPEPNVRYEPRQFPRQFLMLGLSMEEDAQYVAQLGVEALPRLTESGKRPRVLLLDGSSPLEQRISAAFERKLRQLGFVPDRLTVDMDAYRWVSTFFRLVVDKKNAAALEEEPIDQEVDPAGWRQQQMRLRRAEAKMRADAALAEPPYQAIFIALDADKASLVRSRLPLRSRLWATSAVNPGDTVNDPQARSLTFDLLQVGFVESPFVLHFDAAAFEEKYKAQIPATLLDRRLFALGADALHLAQSMARGVSTEDYDGLLGRLTYDLELSPEVKRQSETAMIERGEIVPMTPEDLKAFQVVTFNKRLRRFQQTPVKRAPAPKTDDAAPTGDAVTPIEDEPAIEAPAADAASDLDLTTQALPH